MQFFYDTGFFIGRIIELRDKVKIKFLKQNYIWPKKEDIQDAEKDYIFYGPVLFCGNEPFTIKRYVRLNIEKMYKSFKKYFVKNCFTFVAHFHANSVNK